MMVTKKGKKGEKLTGKVVGSFCINEGAAKGSTRLDSQRKTATR